MLETISSKSLRLRAFKIEAHVQLGVYLDGREGNPQDEQHVGRSLERHEKVFGRAPELYGADRGFYSEQNLALCERRGVKVVCIPQSGGKRAAQRDAYEKTAAFKHG